MILADTCVWSLALRRRRRDLNPVERAIVFDLRDLIILGNVAVIGPVRQELLSGVSPQVFELLRDQIAPQPDLPLTHEVRHRSAEFYNTCRAAGIASDAIDMTICAASSAHNAPIFTIDPDFERYARCLPIKLHKR